MKGKHSILSQKTVAYFEENILQRKYNIVNHNNLTDTQNT